MDDLFSLVIGGGVCGAGVRSFVRSFSRSGGGLTVDEVPDEHHFASSWSRDMRGPIRGRNALGSVGLFVAMSSSDL